MSVNSEGGIVGVCGSLLSLTTVAVGLRFYARKKTKLPIMVDEDLAVASWVRDNALGQTTNKALMY